MLMVMEWGVCVSSDSIVVVVTVVAIELEEEMAFMMETVGVGVCSDNIVMDVGIKVLAECYNDTVLLEGGDGGV